MKIHRPRLEGNFTIIPNETLRDDRLSYLARGVLAEILSRPDDWSATVADLAARARGVRGDRGEGRDTVGAAFRELQEAGYLTRVRTRGERGRISTEVHISSFSAGHTDSGTSRSRSDQRKQASPQVAPTTAEPSPVAPAETIVPAGRTNNGTARGRPDLQEQASSQVAPTTAEPSPVGTAETREIAGRTGNGMSRSRPDQPIGASSQVAPTTGRAVVYKKTQSEDSLSRRPGAPLHALLAAQVPDVTARETQTILEMIAQRPGVRSPGAVLRREIDDGAAAALVAQVRKTRSDSRRASRAPWCGSCSDDRTRQRENEDGQPYRCPVCHPLAIKNAARRQPVAVSHGGQAVPDEMPDELPADWGEWPA